MRLCFLLGAVPVFVKEVRANSAAGNTLFYTRSDDTDNTGFFDAGPDLSSTWETSTVAITLRGTHGDVVMPGPESWSTSDIDEPYTGILPADTRTLLASWLADYVSGSSVTLILDDGVPVNVAPNFADDTGDAVSWTVGVAIGTITVPEATGTPTPTYAVQGSLPGGIAFNASTRQITGTPTGAGSGTITIRATNSEGMDDWSVSYAATVADPLPLAISAGTGSGSVSVALAKTPPPLLLSDFDASGLETDALALIEAAAPIDVYAAPPRTSRGNTS